MMRFIFAAVVLVASLACAMPADAHGGVAFRRTPFRPAVGPVVRFNAGYGYNNFNAFVAPVGFRGYYRSPFIAAPFVASSYVAPFVAAPYIAPAPIVYQQPAQIVAYSQPAPVVSSYQSYSAVSGYGAAPAAYTAQPQAFAAGVTYQLPDGRIVLPSGQVVEPR